MHLTNIFGQSAISIEGFSGSLNYPTLNLKKTIRPKNFWMRHCYQKRNLETIPYFRSNLFAEISKSTVTISKRLRYSVQISFPWGIFILQGLQSNKTSSLLFPTKPVLLMTTLQTSADHINFCDAKEQIFMPHIS